MRYEINDIRYTVGILENNARKFWLIAVFASITLFSIGMFSHNALADQVIATIPTGSPAGEITVNPNTNMIYVHGFGDGWVQVIDGTTNDVVSQIPLSAKGGNPLGIAANPNTNKVYADDARGIEVIDGISNRIIATIPTTCSGDVAVDPNTNKVYVTNSSGGNSVCVIDGSNNTQIGSIIVSPNPRGIEVNPVTDKIYVVSAGGYRASQASVVVIDGLTGMVVKTIPIQCYGQYVGVNSNTDKIYASTECVYAYVINGSDATATQIPLTLWGVGANPNTNKIYASDSSGAIDIINGTTDTIISQLQVSSTSFNLLAVNPITNRVYVSLDNSVYSDLDNTASVVVIDGSNSSPQSPTSLTAATVSSSQINLSWSAPSNNGGSAITGYKIERSTDGGTTWSTVILNTGSIGTTYSDTGLAHSTTYTYRVSAINSVGTGMPSNTASATTLNTVPSVPTDLTATANLLKINLSWTAPSDNGGTPITGYMIERSTDSGNTWLVLVTNTGSTGTTYSDTNVQPLTTYTYRVSAINDVGTSDPSNTASASIPSMPTLP